MTILSGNTQMFMSVVFVTCFRGCQESCHNLCEVLKVGLIFIVYAYSSVFVTFHTNHICILEGCILFEKET